MSENIKILKTAEVRDGFVFLEEESNPLLNNNKYATHFGSSKETRVWGHYCMTYEDAYKDYLDRIKRGY